MGIYRSANKYPSVSARNILKASTDKMLSRHLMYDISGRYGCTELDYHYSLGLSEAVPLGNMSLCNVGGGRKLLSVRQFNYRIGSGFFDGFLDSRNYFFVLTDERFNFIRTVRCDIAGIEHLEDIRLVRYGNVIQISATNVSEGWKRLRMMTVETEIVRDDAGEVCELRCIGNPVEFPWLIEKNYVPIEGERGKFITDMGNGVFSFTTTEGHAMKTKQFCAGMKEYRGSSQLIKYGDRYIAIVHRKKGNKYINAFMALNESMTLARYSNEFVVCAGVHPTNFLCGLSVEDGIAIAPFCINDSETRVFRLPVSDFVVAN